MSLEGILNADYDFPNSSVDNSRAIEETNVTAEGATVKAPYQRSPLAAEDPPTEIKCGTAPSL
jgi:hypothetical protein